MRKRWHFDRQVTDIHEPCTCQDGRRSSRVSYEPLWPDLSYLRFLGADNSVLPALTQPALF
ncbi:hypothetical protein [Bacillus sp. EB01]|uniref:hypothetical protein n=1 Tax=Bacillus sp. EB01 TaxID=1347086 RepID=UPI0012DC7754|nr:hypothetical protein [Bacillus sp. EB01]